MAYYVFKEDKIEGPWEARELISRPGIGQDTLVCTEENFSKWVELGSVQELRLLLQMRAANEQLLGKKREAEKQVRELEDEYEHWARQLHQKIAEQNALLEERLLKLDESAKTLDAKTREAELFKRRLRELKSHYLELKQYSDIQESDARRLRAHLQEKIAEKEEQLLKTKTELDETRRKQDEREHELKERERRTRQNEWEMGHLEEQWREAHSKNKLLEDEKRRLEDELRRTAADAAELRRRIASGEQLVREAPARAMQAELEAEALRETLKARETELERAKTETEHQAGIAREARVQTREAVDRAAKMETLYLEARNRLQGAEQEMVRLRAQAIERDNQTRALLSEKQQGVEHLQAEVQRARKELLSAREAVAAEASEARKADLGWRAREEALKEEARRADLRAQKHREESELFEQRAREASRNLSKLAEKTAALETELERVKRILVRKESRVEMLEAKLRDPRQAAAGTRRPPSSAGGGGDASFPEEEDPGPRNPGLELRLQSHLLRKLGERLDAMEGAHLSLNENLLKMRSEKAAETAAAEARFKRAVWAVAAVLAASASAVAYLLLGPSRALLP